ncbi:hypothetical protein BC940DRAFT_288179 [Gongronella butleri]|nr:hypothetical protein BC940DRAFT_288179 [Gongronella butleri]
MATQSFMNDGATKKQVSDVMAKSLKGKSHSVSNTRRTVQQIIDASIAQSGSRDQQQMLQWVRFCVDTCLSYQDGGAACASATTDATVPNGAPAEPVPIKKKRQNNKPAATTRHEVIDDDDDDDDYAPSDVGASDDDYVPEHDAQDNAHAVESEEEEEEEAEEDQQVPEAKPKKKKKPTSRKPKEPDQPPFVLPNAGAKAVQAYFTGTHVDAASSKNGLGSGYFAKSYFFPSKESFNAFSSVLNSAQKTIDICVFSITDDDVADILIAAKQRKVDVRIITDNQQAAGKGADAERLQKDYGIPYKTDNTTGYMHNKFAIVDSKTMINGSFNWSKGARFKNRENIIVTNLPYCIKEFQAQFDALWAEF